MGLLTNMKAQKALTAHSKGNTEEAYALYTEAYAEGAGKPRFLLPYSILLLRRGEYDKAREVLKKCEKAPGLTPDQRSQTLMNYAVACWKQGRTEYAVNLLKEVHRKGANGTLYGTLGYILVEAGNFEEALAYNKEAVDYDDEDPIALDNLAQTYYRLGNGGSDKEEARKWFEKALSLKGTSIDTNYFLALYDIEDGKYDDALEKLETAKAGRISPLNYATRERIEEAMELLEKKAKG